MQTVVEVVQKLKKIKLQNGNIFKHNNKNQGS